MPVKVTKNLKKLARLLDGELYLVGGFVRNELLRLPAVDIDLAGKKTPSEIKEALSSSDFIVCDEYASFGTLLIKIGDERYEYTTFRADNYKSKHRPESVEFTTDIKTDAKRRDFCCNAIYKNVASGELIDPLKGIGDVEKKILRAANGEKTFCEDGLRLLRLCRLSGELGFSVEEKTFEYAKAHTGKIDEIAPERIRDELDKILVCDLKYGKLPEPKKVHDALMLAKDLGLIERIFPELAKGIGLEQRKDFHKYDVFEHSVYAAAFAEPSIRLFALLHDVGKPAAFAENGNFHSHEKIGAEISKEILTRLKYPKAVVERGYRLTKEHMKGEMRERKLKLYLVKNADIIGDLISLQVADRCACGTGESFSPAMLRRVKLFKEMRDDKLPFSVKELAINGSDVIRIIGEENAVYTGRVLEKLLEKVVTGEIKKGKNSLLQNVERAFREVKNA